MNQIFTKKLFNCIAIIVFLISITSCDRIKIVINTKINEDGSASRRTEYIYSPSNEDELKYIHKKLPDIFEKGFVLPSETDWNIKKLVEDDSFYYISEKNFDSINDLKSDYYKKSQFFGASQNFISFDMNDMGTTVSYNYLEIFKDSCNIIKFSSVFDSYIKTNKIELTQKLYKITNNYIKDFNKGDAEDIVELFIDHAAEFNNIVSKFNIIGPHELKIINDEIESLNDQIRISDFIDYLGDKKEIKPHSQLIRMFKLDKTKLSDDQKQELFVNIKGFIKEEFTKMAKANNIDPLGAYFTSLDMLNSYSIEYTLEIPGDITNSNGNRIDDNTIQWIFEPEDFFNHDYVIIVKSKLNRNGSTNKFK